MSDTIKSLAHLHSILFDLLEIFLKDDILKEVQ